METIGGSERLRAEEFRALRATIRSRGSLRVALSLGGLSGWALTLVTVLAWLPNPVAAGIPLLLLVATFEANRMLHLAVERIGRYLQVFYEEAAAGDIGAPRWEQTVTRVGGSVPGAGGHPLLLPVFLFATVLNLLAVVLPGPTAVELSLLGVPHASFAIWMIVADRAMRQQRTRELARFREMKKEGQRPPA